MLMGRLFAFVAVLLWGAAYVWGKIVLTWLTPLQTSTARFGFGALVLVSIILCMNKPNKRDLDGHYWHYFLLGFIGIACFQGALFFALNITSPINVAVIMALSPVLTAIVESIVSKKMPGIHIILALMVSVAGATLAVLGGKAVQSHGSLNWGDAIAGISALCFTFYTVASKRWLPGHITSLINVTIVVSIGALILLPFCMVFSTLPSMPQSLEPVWALVGLVIGSTAIAYVCWTQAIERIGVSEPNLFFNFTPIVTMILSSFHGAPPTTLQMIGALMVLTGVTGAMLATRAKSKARSAAQEPL